MTHILLAALALAIIQPCRHIARREKVAREFGATEVAKRFCSPSRGSFTPNPAGQYGNQKNWFTTICQRTGGLVYRHGAHRSLVPTKRTRPHIGRQA